MKYTIKDMKQAIKEAAEYLDTHRCLVLEVECHYEAQECRFIYVLVGEKFICSASRPSWYCLTTNQVFGKFIDFECAMEFIFDSKGFFSLEILQGFELDLVKERKITGYKVENK